jgi:hypothetical protein
MASWIAMPLSLPTKTKSSNGWRLTPRPPIGSKSNKGFRSCGGGPRPRNRLRQRGPPCWPESSQRRGSQLPGPRYWGRIAGLLALTAAALWLALSLLPGPDGNQKASLVDPADDANEALPVALAEEIEILSVEEKDAPSLVVGELPVRGPLELLAPGEMDVTSVQPADRDNMVPDYPRQGPATPMIWAHLDSER